jgi:hypothetical protein
MRTKDMTLIAFLVAILVVSQFAFSIVVGINLVFPLLIIYTYNLGFKRTMVINLSFILVRFLMGLPPLTVFLWAWTFTILIIGAHLVKTMLGENEYVAAIFTAMYFILFGFLCGIQEYILTEVPVSVYWLRGLPSDTLGAIAGFVTTLILLKPLSRVIKQFEQEHQKV